MDQNNVTIRHINLNASSSEQSIEFQHVNAPAARCEESVIIFGEILAKIWRNSGENLAKLDRILLVKGKE
jgi:tRNA threonylcarbamoyladenosine modification (KEOPS) complex Cgi121 subunit